MPNEKDNIVVDSFPANSKMSKEKEDRRPEKIVTGKVVKQKKSLSKKFSENFLGDDSKNVGEYVLYDVLIPAAKDTIVEMVKGAIEMLMFGEKRSSNTTRDRGRSYTSYGSYFKSSDRDRRDDRRDISRSARSRHNFDEILLEHRTEAEDVLSHLVDLTVDYGMASVADLYDLVGITSSFTDNKYGWTNLQDAYIDRVRGGYLINLPRTKPLD